MFSEANKSPFFDHIWGEIWITEGPENSDPTISASFLAMACLIKLQHQMLSFWRLPWGTIYLRAMMLGHFCQKARQRFMFLRQVTKWKANKSTWNRSCAVNTLSGDDQMKPDTSTCLLERTLWFLPHRPVFGFQRQHELSALLTKRDHRENSRWIVRSWHFILFCGKSPCDLLPSSVGTFLTNSLLYAIHVGLDVSTTKPIGRAIFQAPTRHRSFCSRLLSLSQLGREERIFDFSIYPGSPDHIDKEPIPFLSDQRQI